jgi:hypothetical protein
MIYDTLGKNDYPKGIITSFLTKFKRRQAEYLLGQERADRNEGSPTPNYVYRSIPYEKHLTEKIAKILQKENGDLKISYKNGKNKVFSRIKDPSNQWLKRNIVYSVPCEGKEIGEEKEECEKEYYGMTTNTMKKRKYGHNGDINEINKIMEENISVDTFKTTLIQHMYETGHKFNTDKMRMIDQTNNKYKLATLEALHIQADIETVVNKRTDTQFIPNNYKTILKIFGEKREKETRKRNQQ